MEYVKQVARGWQTQNIHTEQETEDLDKAFEADEFIDIISPNFSDLIGARDIIYIASAQDTMEKMMKSIAGESKGLLILKREALSYDQFGHELVECVISDRNPFINKRVSELSALFKERYNVGLVTVRAKEWSSVENDAVVDVNESNKDNFTSEAQYALVSKSEEEEKLDQIETGLDMSVRAHAKEELHKEQVVQQAEELVANKTITGNDHILSYGDVALVVADEKHMLEMSQSKDFYVVSRVGALPHQFTFYSFIPVLIFVAMLILVATSVIDMAPAALTVTCVFFIGGWIVPSDIPEMVDIRLLMLIATSLSFARCMTKTKLAEVIAAEITNGATTPFSNLLLIYAITLLITELISNNAAAALMFPIAISVAETLGVNFKAFAMAVLIASTAGFASPIGYQTHVMVWAPGGYRFKDFVIFGIVPDLIYWFVSCGLITVIYPFDQDLVPFPIKK